MAVEPPAGSSLTLSFAFWFLIAQPAMATDWDILDQKLVTIDTGDDMIVVDPDTRLQLRNYTLEMIGKVMLKEMKKPIKLDFNANFKGFKKEGTIEDICQEWDDFNNDNKRKEVFHEFIECFLSFVDFKECPIHEQIIEKGSCNLSKYKRLMGIAKGKSEIELRVHSEGREAHMKIFLDIGPRK